MPKIDALPIKISIEKAREKVEKLLKEKRWKDFTIRAQTNKPSLKITRSSAGLNYRCYYYFNYSATIEKEGVVNKVEIWHSIMDAKTLQIDNSFLKKFSIYDIEEKEEANYEKPKTDKTVLKRIAAVKIAEKFATKKENVEIFEDFIFYCPFWQINVKIEGEDKTYHFQVNAYSGDLNGPEIPEKPETLTEIVEETIEDLKDPKKWVQYTKEIMEKKPITKNKIQIDKYTALYILIILALIIILYLIVQA